MSPRAARRPRWGQNFLVDGAVARSMVDWAAVDGARVLEIGPGRGILTTLLAARAERLWCIEIDPRLAKSLGDRYRTDPRVVVVEGDALEVDLANLLPSPVHVVSSLPYEAGTAIVRRLLEHRTLCRDAVVMLQREVCRRMLAREGCKEYGVLSIHVRMRAEVTAGRIVEATSFRPAPRVRSQIVRLRPLSLLRHPVGDETHFADVVRVAFSERRKMLRNTLGRWLATRAGDDGANAVFVAAGVDPALRPEAVPLEGFARLSLESYRLVTQRAGTS